MRPMVEAPFSARWAAFALTVSLVLIASLQSAQAFNPFGKGEKDSLAIINATPPGGDSTLLATLADPPAVDVSGLSISLAYDPLLWSFVPGMSGFLCEFSDGGSCPPPSAQVGSFLLSSLPYLSVTPGGPLPEASYTLTDVSGVVTLDYRLATPLTVGDGGDINFFLFMFEAKTPFDPAKTMVTFYDTPGTYNFMQTSCSATVGGITGSCSSNTPIYGFDIYRVPGPGAGLPALMALGGFVWARRRKAAVPAAA